MVSAEGPDLPRSASGLGPEGGCAGRHPTDGVAAPGSRAWCAGCSRQVDVVQDSGLGAGSRLEVRLARGPAGRPHPPQDTRALSA